MNRSAFSVQNCLAITVTLGFFTIIGVWMFYPPKGDGVALAVLNTLTGTMGGAFISVISYFFGSSSGSKDKDETIKQMKTGTGSGTILPPDVTNPPQTPPAAP